MIHFLELFLNWAAAEILLSALLFFSYHLWIKRFSNPLDRFAFLSLSFAAILILPWLPVPVVSESFIKNLIIGATISLQDESQAGHSSWISAYLSLFIPAIIPFSYLLVLSIRGVGIFRSLQKLTQISNFGTLVNLDSQYPVVLHDSPIPPMTTGILKPKILLSKITFQSLSKSELRLVIQHEEEHIRRADGLSNLLRILVKEVIFFSPFIWNLARKFEEEMELSVDTAVLSQNENLTRTYGNLLLKVFDSYERETREQIISPIGAYLSNSFIKRRILSMKQLSNGRSKFLSGVALALFMTFGTLGLSLFGTQAYSSSKRHGNNIEFYILDQAAEPHGKPVLTDSDFSSASSDCQEACTLSLQLKSQAQKNFAELSARKIGKKLAIVIEGKVVSSPTIKDKIKGPGLQITADLSKEEAQKIVNNIEHKAR